MLVNKKRNKTQEYIIDEQFRQTRCWSLISESQYKINGLSDSQQHINKYNSKHQAKTNQKMLTKSYTNSKMNQQFFDKMINASSQASGSSITITTKQQSRQCIDPFISSQLSQQYTTMQAEQAMHSIQIHPQSSQFIKESADATQKPLTMSEMLFKYYETEKKQVLKNKHKPDKKPMEKVASKVVVCKQNTPHNSDEETPNSLDNAFCESETSDEL